MVRRRAWALLLFTILLACSQTRSGRFVALGDVGIPPFSFGVREVRLPSGLRVLMEEDHRSPIVGVIAVVGAGAAADPAGKAGMADLSARMTLRARPPGAQGLTLRARLERVGAARLSASATLDQTVFYEFGPRSLLAELLRLEAARLSAPLSGLDAAALAIERDVVRSELGVAHQTAAWPDLLPQMQAALFPSAHPYAHPVQGTGATLQRLTLLDAQTFTQMHYRPDNMTLLILGDVTPGQVEQALRSSLPPVLVGDARHPVPARTAWPGSEPPDPPAAKGLRRTAAPLAQPELWVGWSLPGDYRTDAVPSELLGALVSSELGVNPNGRTEMMERVRQEGPTPITHGGEGLFSLVPPVGSGRICVAGSRCDPFPGNAMADLLLLLSGQRAPQEDPDIESIETFPVLGARATMLICRVGLREGSHPEATAENILDRLRALWYRPGPTYIMGAGSGSQGPSQYGEREKLHVAVLEQTRQGVLGELLLATEDPVQRAALTAEVAHLTLDARVYSHRIRALLAAEPGRLENLAARYLARSRARAVYFAPAPLAAGSASARGSGRQLAADAAPTPGLAPSAIADIVRPLEVEGLRTIRLANGLEVVIGRRAGVPVVTVGLRLLGGTASERPLGALELAQQVALHSGRFGKASDFGAQFSIETAPDGVTYRLRGGAGNLGKMLAILADQMKAPSVPGDAVAEFRKRGLPLLRKREQRPEAVAELAFWRGLFGEHLYGRRARASDLEAVDAAAALRWLRFTHQPRNATLALVGDVDPAAAAHLVETWFASWQNGPEPTGEVRAYFGEKTRPEAPFRPPSGDGTVVVTHVPGAMQAELRLGCLLPEIQKPGQAILYDLMAQLLGRWLDDSVRERLGAGPGAQASAQVLAGGTATLVVRATVANGELGTVLQALRTYWDGLASGPLSGAELDQARWSLARRYAIEYTTTPAIVDGILETRKRGFALDFLRDYPARLAAVPGSELSAAFSACHDASVLAVAGDEPAVRAALAQR